MFHAISTSHLPNPVGGLVTDVIDGFSTPQVLVSREALRFTHRSVILVFHILPRLVWVCDIPIFQTLRSFLTDTSWPLALSAQGLLRAGSLICSALVAVNWDLVAPADVQVIRITSHSFASVPTVLPALDNVRPPTPPLPGRRWTRPLLTSTQALDLPGTASEADSSEEGIGFASLEDSWTEFAVFDVYHHARLLPCRTVDSDRRLSQIAAAATPELGAVFHYRVLTHLLAGLPKRQLVLWGDLTPGSVVFPISFGSGVNAVCTLDVPQHFSAVQACTFMCRHCQLPDTIIDRLVDLDLRLAVNGEVVYPLDPRACQSADSATLHGDLFAAISLNDHYAVTSIAC